MEAKAQKINLNQEQLDKLSSDITQKIVSEFEKRGLILPKPPKEKPKNTEEK